MTWTYDPSLLDDPTFGPLMQTRLQVQDTVETEQQLQDEEITWIIAQQGGMAAAVCAETIAAKYAREVDMIGGGLSQWASQLYKQYSDLAKRLRAQDLKDVVPYVGGISQSDKDSNAQQTDRVKPAFWTGMEENPGQINPSASDSLTSQ